MTNESHRAATSIWRDQPTEDLASTQEQVSARANRERRRAAGAQVVTLLVSVGSLAWAVIVLLERPNALSKALAALPWMLIALAAGAEWWKRRTPGPRSSSSTVEFLRGELTRAVQDCRLLAGWRGFAALLGIMWLTIGARIAADGATFAFAKRGLVEGLGIAIVVPIIVSALIYVVWRWQLLRTAAARQLELDYLKLLER